MNAAVGGVGSAREPDPGSVHAPGSAGDRAPHRTPRRVAAPDPEPTRRLAALAILAAFLVPAGAAGRGPVLCPVRRATGLPCPACGLTRSWAAALHGRPGASLRVHPLGMLALGAAAAYATGLDGPLDPAARTRARAAWPIAVAAWTGVWLVRLGAAARRRAQDRGSAGPWAAGRAAVESASRPR